MGIFPKFRDENKPCLKPPRSFGLACVFWNQYVTIYKNKHLHFVETNRKSLKKDANLFQGKSSSTTPFFQVPKSTEASIHQTFAQSPHQNQVLVKHHDLANLNANHKRHHVVSMGGKGLQLGMSCWTEVRIYMVNKWVVSPTILGTNISPTKAVLKIMFLFPRWDMLVPWRVILDGVFLGVKRPTPLESDHLGISGDSGPESMFPWIPWIYTNCTEV